MRLVSIVLCACLAGCLPRVVERDLPSMCHLARDVRPSELSSTDLIELTAPFPRAHHYAVRSYDAKMAAIIMTAFGAAALVGTFVTGFAVNTSSNESRAAFGGTLGVTIGLGIGALVAGPMSLSARRHSVAELGDEVNHYCPDVEAPPPPPPPEVPQAPAPQAPL